MLSVLEKVVLSTFPHAEDIRPSLYRFSLVELCPCLGSYTLMSLQRVSPYSLAGVIQYYIQPFVRGIVR